MAALGNLIKVAGGIVFAVAGLWGFFLCLAIISKVAGFWGIVAALILGPITFVAAPLYAGFAQGDWFPLALNYGGGIAAIILIGIGSAMESAYVPAPTKAPITVTPSNTEVPSKSNSSWAWLWIVFIVILGLYIGATNKKSNNNSHTSNSPAVSDSTEIPKVTAAQRNNKANHSKRTELAKKKDLRHCLSLESNRDIVRCVQENK